MAFRAFLACFFILLSPITSKAQTNYSFSELQNLTESNADSVIKYLNKIEAQTDIKAVELNYLYSSAAFYLGDYKKTDSLIQYAINTLNFSKDSLLYFKYLQLLSAQRKITDDFESALNLLYEVLAYAKKSKNDLLTIEIHKGLGELYRATEYFDMGLYYLDKGEQIALKLNPIPKKQLAGIYNRRAAILLQSKTNIDSVQALSFKVIKLAKEINDLNLEAIASNELGFLFFNINDPRAEIYLKRAIEIWDQIKYKIYATNAKINLSRYYFKIDKNQESIAMLEDILDEVEKSNWQWEKGGVYEMLGNHYAEVGEYQKAFEFTAKAKDHLLLVSENQYSKRLSLLATQLELKNREDEIALQQKEIEAAKAEKGQLYMFLVFTIIGLIILMMLIFYINLQRNKLSSQKVLIETNNQTLMNLISQKESLLKEVNHRVKNNLSVLSGLLYLQQKELKNKEAVNALKDSQIRITTISLIHESLYQRDDMEKVNFQDYLSRLFEYIKSIYWSNEQPITFSVRCAKFTPELSKSIPLAMIVNEFITNSFKYAFENVQKPEIGIYYNESLNELVYFDNGPGNQNPISKKSLGLKLVEIFSQQIEATIFSEKKGGLYIKKIKFD